MTETLATGPDRARVREAKKLKEAAGASSSAEARFATAAADTVIEGAGAVSALQLRSIIERVERLEEEKREVAEQITEVMSEAKGNGFDVKTIRAVIALRKKKPEQRSEEEAMLDLYMTALGMN